MTNKEYAEKLTKLLTENPDMPVMVWIDTDGICDDYAWMGGSLNDVCIETIVAGSDDMYHQKEDSPYDDCCNYYGYEADDWSDEVLEEKAKAIPWERIISVKVSVM